MRTTCKNCQILLCSLCENLKLQVEVPNDSLLLPVTKVDYKALIHEQAMRIVELGDEVRNLSQQLMIIKAKNLAEDFANLNLQRQDCSREQVCMASIPETDDASLFSLAAVVNNLLNFTAIIEIGEKSYPVRTILDIGTTKMLYC